MTAAPNFAYALFAKRLLRKQAQPGQFDLSTLRWALSGAEPVEPADVEEPVRGRRAVRAEAQGDPAGLRDGRDDGGGVVLRVVAPGLVVDEVDADLPGGAAPGGCRPPRAIPRGWRRWARCWTAWRRASSMRSAI